jgi:hypothetical protein
MAVMNRLAGATNDRRARARSQQAGIVLVVSVAGLVGFASAIRSAGTSAPTLSPPGGDTYVALTDALCRGDFEQVLAATDRADDQSYPLLRLRGRAATNAYWTFLLDSFVPGLKRTLDEEVKLDALARRAMDAYEAAFRAAASAFERARVAGEWWAVYVRTSYDLHSELLRCGLPGALPPPSRQVAERAAQQVAVLERVVRGVVNVSPYAQKLSAAQRDSMVAAFREEFARLAAIGIPDDVFADLVEDLPAFVGFWAPTDFTTHPEAQRNTLRWYLWVALTQSPPHPAERKVIDAQIEAFAERIQTEFDSTFQHPKLNSIGKAYGDKLRETYAALRDNLFCPYFKRAMLSYETQQSETQNEEPISQVTARWRESLQRYGSDAMRAEAEQAIRLLRLDQSSYAESLYQLMLMNYVSPSRPGGLRLALPGVLTRSTGSSVNQHGICTFSVDIVEPFVPDRGGLEPVVP